MCAGAPEPHDLTADDDEAAQPARPGNPAFRLFGSIANMLTQAGSSGSRQQRAEAPQQAPVAASGEEAGGAAAPAIEEEAAGERSKQSLAKARAWESAMLGPLGGSYAPSDPRPPAGAHRVGAARLRRLTSGRPPRAAERGSPKAKRRKSAADLEGFSSSEDDAPRGQPLTQSLVGICSRGGSLDQSIRGGTCQASCCIISTISNLWTRVILLRMLAAALNQKKLRPLHLALTCCDC